MPHVQWPLRRGRPCVQIVLNLAQGGQPLVRSLLADTGAGSQVSSFELVLDENDCLLCGGIPDQPVTLVRRVHWYISNLCPASATSRARIRPASSCCRRAFGPRRV
jgi:hypothetical protein